MTQAKSNLQLYTVRDAAKLLDLSEHTIRRLIKQRKLAVVRIEQRIMLTESGIAHLIKRNTYPGSERTRPPEAAIIFRY
jgi:excisionase family DNA binding protein